MNRTTGVLTVALIIGVLWFMSESGQPTKPVSTEVAQVASSSASAARATPTATARATPTATPPRTALEVLSSSDYYDGSVWYIVGEVRNNGTSPVKFVQVVATYYDDSDRVVGTKFTFARGLGDPPLAPNERAPFKISETNHTLVKRYRLQVSGTPA